MQPPPLVLRFDTADPIALDRVLGAARQSLLGGRVSVLALDIHPAGMNRHVEDALTRWMARNAAVVRDRIEALVYVAPSWWAALAIRLDLRGTPPLVPYAVVRSLADGLSWAAERQARRPRGRPSGR